MLKKMMELGFGLFLGLTICCTTSIYPAEASTTNSPYIGVIAHRVENGHSEAEELPSGNTYEIRIDTHHPILKLYENGRLMSVYDVALGTSATPTPIGHWHVITKQKDWGGGFGTRWLGLNVPWGIYGIHGTNRPASIGHYASNGCIRMKNSDVERLYETIPVGTPVVITGNPLEHQRTIVLGNIGADVQLVQQRLQQAGYFSGQCDGRFGAATQFSLSLFELAHHLPMDAVVGPDDYHALGLTTKVGSS